MFGFLKSKTPGVAVNDKIWMSSEAKWKACRDMLDVNGEIIFVAWFRETHDRLFEVIGAVNSANVIIADEVDIANSSNRLLVFVEHYPLPKIEQELFLKLGLNEVPVLSSLDEPLFMLFGGEKTIRLMKQLGMEEGEVLGHTMITKAIRQAQSKIEKKVVSDQHALSQEAWFRANYK